MTKTSGRLWPRRVVRVTTVVGVPLATAFIAGPAVAGAVVVVGALLWEMVRWERWGPRRTRTSTEVERWQPESSQTVTPQGGGAAIGPEGHRAFAQALHAVAAAYLAECERDADR
jgi:hypothetical protein